MGGWVETFTCHEYGGGPVVRQLKNLAFLELFGGYGH